MNKRMNSKTLTVGKIRILHVTGFETPCTSAVRICKIKKKKNKY